jgi:hypothetical protein
MSKPVLHVPGSDTVEVKRINPGYSAVCALLDGTGLTSRIGGRFRPNE